jgi:hypothetical protein
MFQFIPFIDSVFGRMPTVVAILFALVVLMIHLLLNGVILRAACDLCSVPPPGILKAVGLVVILTLLSIPASDGVAYLINKWGTTTRMAPEGQQLFAITLSLVAGCLLTTLTYTIALRVQVWRAARIWFFQTCVTALVLAVIGLTVMGSWTIVEGIRRVV